MFLVMSATRLLASCCSYGTIVSHNVPPYGRAGLYKQLATLKDLLTEYRGDPDTNAALKPAIVDNLALAGLQDDCPYVDPGTLEARALSAQDVDQIPASEFNEYASKLYQYLQVTNNERRRLQYYSMLPGVAC